MGLISEFFTVCRMILPSSGGTHQERLEDFYSTQASGYDSFRRKLLKGREELWKKFTPQEGQIWADIGGGTGNNITYCGEHLAKLKKVYIVDLADSLLKVADERIKANGWSNVETVCADATTWVPPEGKVDIVTFSYSLTMIPDWFAAIEQAKKILSPGGTIGVVDFYVSRKYPASEKKKHGFLSRHFWPAWFAYDNVFPSCDHLPYLCHHFEMTELEECKGRIPWHPFFWWKMPYYIFTGQKKENS